MVLLFGALGWCMVRLDWQRPPLLLGLVLGHIAESNFFISTKIYGASWLAHPGVIVIIVLILAALLYPMFQAWQKRHQQDGESLDEGPVAPTERTEEVTPGSRAIFSVFSFALVLVFIYVLAEAFFGFGVETEQAALFPIMIGIPGLALSLVAFGKELTLTHRVVQIEEGEPVEPSVARRRMVMGIGWVMGFFVFIWLLGFTTASLVATFSYLKFGAGEKWPITVVLTFFAWVFFYGIFDYMLHLPFPPGVLFTWLGMD